MQVELLVIDDCPNSEEAHERIAAALAALDWTDVQVLRTVLTEAAQADKTGFAGSPTITLDGADIFPGASPTGELSCRVYQTPDGLAGLPTADQIRKALQDRMPG